MVMQLFRVLLYLQQIPNILQRIAQMLLHMVFTSYKYCSSAASAQALYGADLSLSG